MREVERYVEKYLKNAYEVLPDEFTYVDVSLMDIGHETLAKVLKQNIYSSDRGESAMNSHQEAELTAEDVKPKRRELCYYGTETFDRSHVESVVEMLLGVVNKQVVQPFLFHTAAYEANFTGRFMEKKKMRLLWKATKRHRTSVTGGFLMSNLLKII